MMDDTSIAKLSTQLRKEATAWRAQARRINRSKCFDGDRNMRIGMAIANERCADQLDQRRVESGEAVEAVELAAVNESDDD